MHSDQDADPATASRSPTEKDMTARILTTRVEPFCARPGSWEVVLERAVKNAKLFAGSTVRKGGEMMNLVSLDKLLWQSEGVLGWRIRRDLTGEIAPSDREEVSAWRTDLADQQLADGSWEGQSLVTASHLRRMVELGGSLRDPEIRRGTEWLLSLPEMVGLPGLFPFSRPEADRFNRWKQKTGVRGRFYWHSLAKEVSSCCNEPVLAEAVTRLSRVYLERWQRCELRVLVPTVMAVEVLLRLELEGENRLRKAINTLLALRLGNRCSRNWQCGCTWLSAELELPSSAAVPDFSPADRAGSPNHLPPADAAGIAPLLIHRALSFHSRYAGSDLEEQAIQEWLRREDGQGHFPLHYTSSFFTASDRFSPARILPLWQRCIALLSTQRWDTGWWQESPIPGNFSPPDAAESTWRLRRALHRMKWPA
jgi:hypothetical protein